MLKLWGWLKWLTDLFKSLFDIQEGTHRLETEAHKLAIHDFDWECEECGHDKYIEKEWDNIRWSKICIRCGTEFEQEPRLTGELILEL